MGRDRRICAIHAAGYSRCADFRNCFGVTMVTLSTDDRTSNPEVHEWLRRLKVQAEQVVNLNSSRVQRGAIARLFQLPPEEMLRVVDVPGCGEPTSLNKQRP